MIARLLILLTLSPLAALAEARHDCGSDQQNATSYKFCIDTPDHPSGEILWYFHPVLGSEQDWQNYGDNQKIREGWASRGGSPTVISISMGKFWLLNRENGSYGDFTKLILPALEAKAGGLHGRRLLLGYSMGGFNASQLLLRDGALFARVALLSPAFLTIGPYSSQAEVDAYMQRNNLDFTGRFKVNAFLDALRSTFPNEASWKAHDPLVLVQNGLAPGSTVYVSDGDEDNYGFHEGSSQFVNEASTRGTDVQWESLHGGHRATDPEAVARFLIP